MYYGFTSEVFRRREAASPLPVKEWHCFSLQLPDRTLDFAAPTDQEAVAWTICLRTLCYGQVSYTWHGLDSFEIRLRCVLLGATSHFIGQGVWEAGKRLVVGDVLWKRAALK